MKSIWGKSCPANSYSEQAIAVFAACVDLAREDFKKEFPSHVFRMTARFNDDRQILWVLESKVSESEFLNNTKHYLMAVLLGAAEADEYYYEKYENER
jgi:hypothetical protein